MSSEPKRIVVITGASSGIGLAAARAFLSNGDTVYSFSRTKPPEEAIRFLKTDVTDTEAVALSVAEVLREAGKIDVLVLNAGMGVSGAVEFESIADAQKQFDVCFFGAARAVRTALPALRASKGTALFVSSVAADIPIPFQAYYSAAKAAISAFTFALRNELRASGVRIAAVLPGDIHTGFTASRNKCMEGAEAYPAMQKSVATMEHDEQHGMPPACIANHLVALSKQKHPKPFSTVGLNYKLFLFLARILPARFLNWLVSLIYA